MIVRAAGGLSAPKTLTVLSAAPGIFHTATAGPLSDLPAVYRQKNGQVVTLSNPIHPDDYLVIYLAGLGATEPPVAAGNAAACDPLALVVSAPTVTLGGVQLGVEFAGLVPGEIGVYQVNAFVPVTVPIGWSIPLVIDQGGQSTTLDVRVVD